MVEGLTRTEKKYAKFWASWDPGFSRDEGYKLSEKQITSEEIWNLYTGRQQVPEFLKTTASRWLNQSKQSRELPDESYYLQQQSFRRRKDLQLRMANTARITATGIIQFLSRPSRATRYQVARAYELDMPIGTGKGYSQNDLEALFDGVNRT